jgi:hypothetical protein
MIDPYIKFSEAERDALLLAVMYYLASTEPSEIPPEIRDGLKTGKEKLLVFFSPEVAR